MQGRRGTLYHVEQTKGQANQGSSDELIDIRIRKKFASGRYLFSGAGILQLVTVVTMLAAAILFLSTDVCPKTPPWYPWLYPLVTLLCGIITAAIFALFVLGVAEDNPSTWVKGTLVGSMLEVIAIIAISIITITSCDSALTIHQVPGPLGLAGAVVLAIATAALFIMWRYREEEGNEVPSFPQEESNKPRKSIFI